jgi:uncharacterized protein
MSRDGEPGQNYLCSGLELFFKHTQPAMRNMMMLLQQGHAPSNIMNLKAAEDARRTSDKPCTCRGGKTFGDCHGNSDAVSNFSSLRSTAAAVLLTE